MRMVRLSVVPLAGDHAEVGASLGAEVGNHVRAAVDVGKSLVEAYIKHGELVVVAENTLEESLVGEAKLGKVVV